MLHRVALFSSDYILGLIIEALEGQKYFPEEHQNYRGREFNTTRCGAAHSPLFKKFPTKRIVLTSGTWRMQALLSAFLLPSFLWGQRRKVDRKKGKIRKRINILHCLKKKNHLIYIEILGYRVSSKKREFPCLFVCFSSAYGKYLLLKFFWWFLSFFYVKSESSTVLLQRTPSPVTILDKNPGPFFSHSDILYLQLHWLHGVALSWFGLCVVPLRNEMRIDCRRKLLKLSFIERVKKLLFMSPCHLLPSSH